MKNILTLSYWFALYPGAWQQSGNIILLIILGLISLGVVGRVLASFLHLEITWKRSLEKFSTWFLTYGILALFYWFMRDQQVPFFSSRFWLLIMFFSSLAWLYFIVRYVLRKLRDIRQTKESLDLYTKYLPGKKT
jgi:hypothetical protein